MSLIIIWLYNYNHQHVIQDRILSYCTQKICIWEMLIIIFNLIRHFLASNTVLLLHMKFNMVVKHYFLLFFLVGLHVQTTTSRKYNAIILYYVYNIISGSKPGYFWISEYFNYYRLQRFGLGSNKEKVYPCDMFWI